MRIRKTAPKEFTIDRSKWVHGEANSSILGDTSLLNTEGNMCCLGFYARACGATKASIDGHAFPDRDMPLMGTVVTNQDYGCGNGLVKTQSAFCTGAADINDDGSITKKERENEVKLAFKEQGVKIKFVGRYPKGVV